MIKPNVEGDNKVSPGIEIIYTRSANQTRYWHVFSGWSLQCTLQAEYWPSGHWSECRLLDPRREHHVLTGWFEAPVNRLIMLQPHRFRTRARAEFESLSITSFRRIFKVCMQWVGVVECDQRVSILRWCCIEGVEVWLKPRGVDSRTFMLIFNVDWGTGSILFLWPKWISE